MNFNQRVRQTHRWLSAVFTAFVLVNVAVNVLPVRSEELAVWVGMLTLIPLALLLITGLYLFALPYIMSTRTRPSTDP